MKIYKYPISEWAGHLVRFNKAHKLWTVCKVLWRDVTVGTSTVSAWFGLQLSCQISKKVRRFIEITFELSDIARIVAKGNKIIYSIRSGTRRYTKLTVFIPASVDDSIVLAA